MPNVVEIGLVSSSLENIFKEQGSGMIGLVADQNNEYGIVSFFYINN